MKTKVVLVDDHRILRDGLRLVPRKEPDLEVVGEGATVAEALAWAAQGGLLEPG